MGLRMGWLTVDSRDPKTLGSWWLKALPDYHLIFEDDDGDEFAIQGPEGRWNILFYRVPDEKVVKNRLHLDLIPDDQAAEVERVKALGAREIDIGQKDVTWVVMADPEGNEFCILTPRDEPR